VPVDPVTDIGMPLLCETVQFLIRVYMNETRY